VFSAFYFPRFADVLTRVEDRIGSVTCCQNSLHSYCLRTIILSRAVATCVLRLSIQATVSVAHVALTYESRADPASLVPARLPGTFFQAEPPSNALRYRALSHLLTCDNTPGLRFELPSFVETDAPLDLRHSKPPPHSTHACTPLHHHHLLLYHRRSSYLRNSHLLCGTSRVPSLVRTQCLASMPSSSRKQMPRSSERGMIRHRQLRVQQKHRQSSTPRTPTNVWTAGLRAWRRPCTRPKQTSGHLQPSQRSRLTSSLICFPSLRAMKGCA
jgi:hypothetical protein